MDFTIPDECQVITVTDARNGTSKPHIHIKEQNCFIQFLVYVTIRHTESNFRIRTPVSQVTFPAPKRFKAADQHQNHQEQQFDYQIIPKQYLKDVQGWNKQRILSRMIYPNLFKILEGKKIVYHTHFSNMYTNTVWFKNK